MSTSSTNTVETLLQQWRTAKDSEQQWAAYRKSLEDQISSLAGNFEGDLKSLADSTTLTRTVKLPGVSVQIGYDLVLKQPEVTQFLQHHPEMLNVLLKVEYKHLSSKAFLTAAQQDTEIGQDLRSAFELKAKRPYYSLTEKPA